MLRRLTIHLGFVFALILICEATAEAATRVALVSGDRSDAGKNIITLAQVQLSIDSGFALLERDEIQRVVEEQKLFASGIVDASQVVAVGRLMMVDLFVVLEAGTGNDSISSVVIFDAHSGIRYWDSTIRSHASVDEASASLIQAVRDADRKRLRQKKDLHTVGVITIRNADLPRDHDGLCDTVGFLVERNLPRSPDIAILERRRLERVNEERSLPTAEQSSDLLASLSTIDLEIARGNGGKGLRATALVKQAGKDATETVTTSIADSNIAALADAIARKLMDHFHAAPAVGTPDPREEANRFDSEASHHISHERYADAVRAQGAAWALDSTNEDYTERLARYLVIYASALIGHPNLNDVEAFWFPRMEASAFETMILAARRGVELNIPLKSASAHHAPFNWRLADVCRRVRALRKKGTPQMRSQIDEFLRLCLRRSLNHCEAMSREAEADLNRVDFYTGSIYLELSTISSASLDATEYTECMFEIASRWLHVTGQSTPEHTRTNGGDLSNMVLRTFASATSLEYDNFRNEPEKVVTRMVPVFEAMQRHTRPIVRLYGHFGQIRIGALLAKDREDAHYARFSTEYRRLVQSIISSPEPWDADRTRYAAYLGWRQAIDDMPGESKDAFVTRELIELCQFMASRHELVEKGLDRTFQKLERPVALQMINQLRDGIESSSNQRSEDEKTRLRNYLNGAEQEVLARRLITDKVGREVPWSHATLLFDVTYVRGLGKIVGSILIDNSLYVVSLNSDQGHVALCLIRVSLTGEPPRIIDTAKVGMTDTELPDYKRHQFLTTVCTDDANIYIATNGAGIVVFPRRGGPPQRITVSDGLPSNNLSALAVVDQKLYAGFTDGYLVCYDTKSQATDVLASSRRKQKLSPLDDGKVFSVTSVLADPTRQRVVFVVGRHLWQLNPSTNAFKQVLELDPKDAGDGWTPDWCGRRQGDRFLASNLFRVLEIDLSKDQYVDHSVPGILNHAPLLMTNTSLWMGGSFARVPLAKIEKYKLPSPDNGPDDFRPTTCLEQVSAGKQLLVADAASVWLLDLSEGQSKASPSPAAIAVPNPALTLASPPTVAAPAIKGCVARATITTEDNRPVDWSKCACYVQSWRNPIGESNGELRFGSASGSTQRPIDGVISQLLPAGMFSLGLLVPGYAPVALGYKEGKPGETLNFGTIQLQRGFPWKLNLRNESGRPVVAAEITAICRFNNVGTTAISDVNGDATFPNAAPEEYTLTLRAPGHQPTSLQKVTASESKLRIVMQSSRPTTGRILTEDGRPLEGASILMLSDSTNRVIAKTGADGAFVLDQLPDDGTHFVRVELNKQPRLALTNVVAGKTGLEWKLPPLIRLSGTVTGLLPTDVRNMSYEQCVLTERGQAIAVFQGTTRLDADGKFVINDLFPGVIRFLGFRLRDAIEVPLQKTQDDYVLNLPAPKTTQPSMSQPGQTDFKPSSASKGKTLIRVKIVNEEGAILQGQGSVHSLKGPLRTNSMISGGRPIFGSGTSRGVSISSGAIQTEMDPGMIGMGISVSGYAPVSLGMQPGGPDEVVDFGTITLEPGFTWDISVINDDSQPVANADIALIYRFAPAPFTLKSDAAGRAELTHAAEGEYEVIARAPGCQPLKGLKLRATAGKQETISMRRSKPTTGIIVDENDRPVAGAKILLVNDHVENFQHPRELVTTDLHGNFVLDQLADEKTCTVRVEFDGKLRLVVPNVESNKSKEVWKLMPSLTLKGRIVGIAPGAQRLIHFTHHRMNQEKFAVGIINNGSVNIGDDGTFQIEGLIPGAVTLSGFGRQTEIELPKSRTDYVLDLGAPDPAKPQNKLILAFVHDDKPVTLTGTLKGCVIKKDNKHLVPLNLAIKNQSSIEINAFVPGTVNLNPECLAGAAHCFAERSYRVEAGESTLFVDMLPASSISGVVRDAKGIPVTDAWISAQIPGTDHHVC